MHSQFVRWQVITAFDIIVEVALIVMSVGLVWNLQMAVKLKCKVIAAFALRLPSVYFLASANTFL